MNYKKYGLIAGVLIIVFVVSACSGKTDADTTKPDTTQENTTKDTDEDSAKDTNQDAKKDTTQESNEEVSKDSTQKEDANKDTTNKETASEDTKSATLSTTVSPMGVSITYDQAYFLQNDVENQIYFNSPDQYEQAYFSIQKYSEYTKQELIDGLVLQNDYTGKVTEKEIGVQNYSASTFSITMEGESSALNLDFYVVEHNGSIYLIEVTTDQSARDGLGAQMDEMLKSITFQ